jgi:hypothetical protein
MLRLVEPRAGRRRRAHERRELRGDELRQRRARGALRAPGRALHALGPLCGDVDVVARLVVIALDEKPVSLGLREHPAAVELFSLEGEVQAALAQRRGGIGILGAPRALVPEQHVACAILLLRDHALELAVLEGMVLGLHREAPLGGIEARALRHRPALQHAVELQAKVVVQPRRVVSLNVVAQLLAARRILAAAGLRRAREIAHLAVSVQSHRG